MFIAALIMLGLGATASAIGVVCLIGWVVKKFTE
jgi:hypothetical protein